MEKFNNKYRIQSARASWWNYGWAGAYFITICTQNRQHYFGEIVNGKMALSNCGVLANVFWHEIQHHAKSVELGAFVVMPNHIHGILVLNDNINTDNNNIDIVDANVVDIIVETRHALSLPLQTKPQMTIAQQRFQNQGKNTVSAIIGSYKSAVTKHANRLGFENGWQSRFHDHIIRNDAEYQKINDYIETNPMNWGNDKFFKQETL